MFAWTQIRTEVMADSEREARIRAQQRTEVTQNVAMVAESWVCPDEVREPAIELVVSRDAEGWPHKERRGNKPK